MSASEEFTCVIPVYRGDVAAHFAEALRSIEGSGLRPSDILICEDGELPADLRDLVDHAVTRLGARSAR